MTRLELVAEQRPFPSETLNPFYLYSSLATIADLVGITLIFLEIKQPHACFHLWDTDTCKTH